MTDAGGSPPDDGPPKGAKAAKIKRRKGSRGASREAGAAGDPSSDDVAVEASNGDVATIDEASNSETDSPVDASNGEDASSGEDAAIDASNGEDAALNASNGDDAALDASNGEGGLDATNSEHATLDASNGEDPTDDVNGQDGQANGLDALNGTSLEVVADASVDTSAADGDAVDGPLPELPSSAAAMDARQLKHLVEALIFASDKPVTAQRLRQLTRVSEVRRLEQALAELAEDYRDRGLVLQQVSGGYQFRTRTQFSVWVQQLIAGRPVRLSRAQLETLAIVAYRQPITRPEIDDIRGVDSSQTLKLLLDRALVRILGKKEEVGRPMLYGTTKEFLDFFSLGDLRELPTLREYSELTDESRRVISDRLGDEAPAEEPTDDPEEPASEQSQARSLEDDLQAYVDADDEPHHSHVAQNDLDAASSDDDDVRADADDGEVRDPASHAIEDTRAGTGDVHLDDVPAETSTSAADHHHAGGEHASSDAQAVDAHPSDARAHPSDAHSSDPHSSDAHLNDVHPDDVPAETSASAGDVRGEGEANDGNSVLDRAGDSERHVRDDVPAETSASVADRHDADDVDQVRDHASGDAHAVDAHLRGERAGDDRLQENVPAETSASAAEHHHRASDADDDGLDHARGGEPMRDHTSNDTHTDLRHDVPAETVAAAGEDDPATDEERWAPDVEIKLHASLNDPRVIGYAAGSVDLDSLEAISDEPSDVEALAEAAVEELGPEEAPPDEPSHEPSHVDHVASTPDPDDRSRES